VLANKKPSIAQKWFYKKEAVQKKAQNCGAIRTGELPPQMLQIAPLQNRAEHTASGISGNTTNGAKQIPTETASFDDKTHSILIKEFIENLTTLI